ncbi:DHHW family protein [Oceanobacillus senegalensis]|uniref:DHHW family protein n=1 Tax=Oceanobacillus senegalensis TaxID=1936063 RepID=UPI000A308961|nr:DHHW family protein [Oceanobacillus senegalensis]
MKSFGNILVSFLFVAFIFFFGITTFLTPDKETSDTENRTLAQRPPITPETIVNGEYTRQFDSYLTDQFYLRDGWIKSYLSWQLLTNQTFVYDYYVQDEWVYPKPFTEIDKNAIQFAVENMKELNHYTKKNQIELYYFSIPDRRHMLHESYPRWVDNSLGQADKELFLSSLPKDHINIIDIGQQWNNQWGDKDYHSFYFSTDHHWNMYGAFAGYEVIRETLQENSSIFHDGPLDKESYHMHCLNDRNFLGTYNRQLFGMIDASGEALCYVENEHVNIEEWTTYVDGMSEEHKVHFSDVYGKAKQSDDDELVTYTDVYAGDHSEVHILNPEKANDNTKILFLKDSYANTLLPLLAEHFYHTTFYDVRHNEGESLYEFIEKHDYDAVAFLYSNGRTLEYLYDFEQNTDK